MMSNDLSPAAQFAAAAQAEAEAEAQAQAQAKAAAESAAAAAAAAAASAAAASAASAASAESATVAEGASAPEPAVSSDPISDPATATTSDIPEPESGNPSEDDAASAVAVPEANPVPAVVDSGDVPSNVSSTDSVVPATAADDHTNADEDGANANSAASVEDDNEPASAAAMFESAVDSAVASTSGDGDGDDSEPLEKKPVHKPKRAPLDLANEELFPSLGGPSPAKAAPLSSWGAGKSTSGASTGPRSMAAQLKANSTTEVFDLPIMQDSVGDVARKIMDRTQTKIEISHNKILKTSTYLITGKRDNVARAKREICAKLSPQITRVIQIPAIARAQVVGVRGRSMQGIQSRTGTSINMAKRTTAVGGGRPGDDDMFELVDVNVTGDAIGVSAALAEIEAIVDQRTTKRAVRLTSIPSEYNALLIGSNGTGLTALQEAHKDVKIRIPDLADANQDIMIVGERDAVNDAAVAVEKAAADLKQNTQTVTVTIPKRQHQFIVGERSSTLKEILNTTGCIALVPAPTSASDQVTVRGLESNLVQALGLVMSKANSVTVETVDPTTIHTYERPLLYTRRALRYFHDRNRFRRIESEHGVSLRIPSVGAAMRAQSPDQVQIEIQGSDARSVAAARQAVTSLFGAFPPFNFNSIDVEPHLHALLSGRDGANVARLQAARSVYALFPRDGNAANPHEILVVYEGFNPDIDSLADRAQREQATRDLLRKTLEEFRNTIQKDSSYVTKVVAVPAKIQQALAKASALEELLKEAGASEGTARAVVELGAVPSSEPESTRFTRKKDDVAAGPEEVAVKGLGEAVDRVIAQLTKRVRDAEEYTRLHSFRDEFAVPQQFLSRVIGRGGENLKRIRAERDIVIDIVDSTSGAPGMIKLQGTAEDVAAVRAEIVEFVERMADQTAETISVPANIHRSLIGTGGRYVKRLEEKYGVRIQFPSSRRENDDEALNADQIRIRGGRKGVDGAKGELLELADYEVEHNHTVKFNVPAAYLPHIVGRAGVHINDIKDESGARIDFADPKEGETEVETTVIGTRAGVKLAREAIEAIVAEQAAQTEVTLDVPTKHHRFLIGAGGSRVRELVTQAGGDPEAMSGARSCRVQFPRASEGVGEVRLKGDRAVVDKVKEHIERLVEERERMTTIVAHVPVSQHAFIIGRGGAQLKQLQDEHSVEIHFHSKGSRSTSDDPTAVHITGLPENCEACKGALLALVREEQKVTVPLAVHRKMGGRGGSLWRRVRSEFDVQIDAGSVDKAAGGSSPRIDNSDEDLVVRPMDEGLEGLNAEWILRGEKTKLAQALALVHQQIESAEAGIEARLRVDPRQHRHIIGKHGSHIAKIRDATSCDVQVPKRGSDSPWVVITGDRECVDRAIEMIHEAIDEDR